MLPRWLFRCYHDFVTEWLWIFIYRDVIWTSLIKVLFLRLSSFYLLSFNFFGMFLHEMNTKIILVRYYWIHTYWNVFPHRISQWIWQYCHRMPWPSLKSSALSPQWDCLYWLDIFILNEGCSVTSLFEVPIGSFEIWENGNVFIDIAQYLQTWHHCGLSGLAHLWKNENSDNTHGCRIWLMNVIYELQLIPTVCTWLAFCYIFVVICYQSIYLISPWTKCPPFRRRHFQIRVWVTNYINCFMWDLIVYPCPYFNDG